MKRSLSMLLIALLVIFNFEPFLGLAVDEQSTTNEISNINGDPEAVENKKDTTTNENNAPPKETPKAENKSPITNKATRSAVQTLATGPVVTEFGLEPSNPPEKYYAGIAAGFNLKLGLSDSGSNLENSTVEVRIPADFISSTSNISAPYEADIHKGVPSVTKEGNEYVIRYELRTVSSGTTSSVPFTVTLANGKTPAGYELPIKASILDADKKEITTANTSVVYSTRTPKLRKYVRSANSGTSGTLSGANMYWHHDENARAQAYAGVEDPNKTGYISQNDLTPIEFNFSLPSDTNTSGSRYYNKFEISDEIPEGAVFRQEENPGWVYDEATRTASYILEIDKTKNPDGILSPAAKETTFHTDGTLPSLKLYFPGVQINKTVKNSMKVKAYAVNSPDYEEPITINDDLTVKLVKYVPPALPTVISALKSPDQTIIYDTPDFKEAFSTAYLIRIQNDSNLTQFVRANLSNIVMDDNKLDEHLYFSKITIPKKDATEFVGSVKLEITFDDNSTAILADNLSIATEQVFDLSGYDQKVKGVKLSTTEGSYLLPAGNLQLRPEVKIRDPQNLNIPPNATNKTLSNSVNLTALYEGATKAISSSRSTNISLEKYEPKFDIIKTNKSNGGNVVSGGVVPYELVINARGYYKDETYKFTEIVDLLPEGFEYVTKTARVSATLFTNSIPTEPKIVPNYKQTGRTALIWDIGEVTAKSTSNYAIGNTTTVNKFATITYNLEATGNAEEGINNNDVYLGWLDGENVSALDKDKITPDIYDINKNGINGEEDDTVLKATASTIFQPAKVLSVSKAVKGNLDEVYLKSPLKGSSEIGERGSYEIKVRNNSPADVSTLTLLDILPYVGDKTFTDSSGEIKPRNSEFSVKLTGPIKAPEGYTVYYTADAPKDNAADYTTTANWQTTMTDYSTVRAIKIVLNSGEKLATRETLTLNVPFEVPYDKALINDEQAINTVGQSVTSQYNYTESNNSILKIMTYNANGYVFEDLNRDGQMNAGEPTFKDYTVTLVDKDGNVVKDKDDNPYVVKTNKDGFYNMNVFKQGDYRIKVERPKDGFVVTELSNETKGWPNHLLDDETQATDVFKFDITNDKVTRNAGFYNTNKEVTVEKKWDDADNQDGKRPTTVKMKLEGNGEAVEEEAVLSEATNWKYTWNVPKEKDGEAVNYTVKEVDVPESYTASIDAKDPGNVIVTNSHTPEVTEVSGKKVWDDADNQDGVRPESVEVNLLANGELKDTKVVDEKENWTFTFSELPKYNNGELINYTVTENTVEGYSTEIKDFEITNKRTLSETSVTVTKAWDDANNQDGKRPEKVSVQLKGNGKAVGEPVELDATTDWTHTWTVPKNEKGKAIDYTVQEVDVPEGYESTINDENKGNIIITNSYTPEVTNVSGSKTWDDADNQDGVRPNVIKVNLLANGEEVEDVDVKADDNWNYTFKNVAKYKDGKEITYTVTEDAVEGYATSTDGHNITNKRTLSETSVTVTKAWDDANNQDGKRPEKVSVQLKGNGKAVGEPVELDATTDWTHTWTVPKNEKGKAIDYTVQEVNVAEGYESIVQDEDQGNIIITNSHIPEETTVEGVVTWDDADNQDGKRPDTVVINVEVDGEIVDSKTVKADEDWKYIFNNLPKYKDGKEINYTVTQNSIEDYETEINGTNVVNKHVPSETSVTVTKEWNDADDQDGVRPEKVEVNLLADGQVADTKEVEAKDGWTYTFTKLPEFNAGQRITYTVTENTVDGYSTEIDGYTITNNRTPSETSVTVTKAWDDANNQDGKRPETVKVQLEGNGKNVGDPIELSEATDWTYTWTVPKNEAKKAIEYKVKEVDVKEGYTSSISAENLGNIIITNSYTPEVVDVSGTKTWDDKNDQDGVRPASIRVNVLANGQVVDTKTVEAKDNWNYTFKDLPKYKDGKEVVYTVTEDAIDDYKAEIDGFNIKNTRTVTETSVTVTKAWDDANNQDGKRPTAIKVQLVGDGKASGNAVTLDESTNWTHTWTVPKNASGKAIKYTVQEVDVPKGYVSSINDANAGNIIITNSYTPEVIDVTGTKTWKDANDQDGMRPESIKVNLLADGQLIDTKTVKAADQWTYTFSDLPKNKNGKAIKYTVTENAIEGYKTTIEGYNITNTHEPAKTAISVTKMWNDKDDKAGKRPQNIMVNLLANGNKVDAIALNESMDWKYKFDQLPKYQDGKEIEYKVIELDVSGYQSQISGTAEKGFIITNTIIPNNGNSGGSNNPNSSGNSDGTNNPDGTNNSGGSNNTNAPNNSGGSNNTNAPNNSGNSGSMNNPDAGGILGNITSPNNGGGYSTATPNYVTGGSGTTTPTYVGQVDDVTKPTVKSYLPKTGATSNNVLWLVGLVIVLLAITMLVLRYRQLKTK